MGQDHLVLDFSLNGPANAKPLADEFPPLVPDLVKVQDDLGTAAPLSPVVPVEELVSRICRSDLKTAKLRSRRRSRP